MALSLSLSLVSMSTTLDDGGTFGRWLLTGHVPLHRDSVVETTVHLIGSLKELDIGIRVDMKVKVKGAKKEDIEALVAKTKEVCPYSRATQGNVVTNVEVMVE